MVNRKMMRQAQQLQNRLAKVQQELEELTVEGSAGGGVVRVHHERPAGSVCGGHRTGSGRGYRPPAGLWSPLPVNDASARTQQMAAEKMNAVTGGLNIPGLT